ncbi:MAG: hypothetical protein ACFCD0_28040 [Gemmataceae bacterium]
MNRDLKIYLSIVVCTLPLISYCYFVYFWLLASVALGEWVRPSIHDPSDFFYGIPLKFGFVLFLSSFVLMPLVLFLGHKQGRVVFHVVVYLGSLILAIVLFRSDIQQITTWLMD